MRWSLPACLLLSALACRGDPPASNDPPAGSDQAVATGELEAEAGPSNRGFAGDPFAGIEALRPEPWTAWPLENVDIRKEAGWRISPVSGNFELEEGLTFAADDQAFVLAIAPGKVLAVEHRDQALELVIDHGDGIESRYSPLSDALVHPGLPVSRGAAIGLVHGRSLRLLVTVDGVAIDPLLVLRQPLHRWPALSRSLPPAPAE